MSDKLLDRFAAGKLSPAESRELAQKALDDHDLFDRLTSAAIARRGLAASASQQIRWPRFAIFAAAAAIIGVAIYMPRRHTEPVRPEATRPEVSRPEVATSSPPVLLARNSDSNPATFRGLDSGSREPRETGSVSAIADGVATIDVGSIDGLVKGAEVDMTRSGQTAGRIRLTTIFRDHARGEIAGGTSIRVNDEVRVPPAARLRAILDRIDATLARGETEKAMTIAQQASVQTFDAGLSGAQDLNNAGVIAELHGNRDDAGQLYRRALQSNPSGPFRQAIEKNLARLKGAQ